MKGQDKEKTPQNKYAIDEVNIDYRESDPYKRSLSLDEVDSSYMSDYRDSDNQDDGYDVVQNINNHNPVVVLDSIDTRKENNENEVIDEETADKPHLKLAVFLLLLILLGSAVFASKTNDYVAELASVYSSTYDSYNSLVAPLVMADIAPFDNISQVNTDTANCVALTHLLITQNKEGYTAYDSNGNLLIPLDDVKKSATDVFGAGYNLIPSSPSSPSFYTFSSEDNLYHISECTDIDKFSPYITGQKIEGDTIQLTVAYVSPDDDYRVNPKQTKSPTPSKSMQYELKKNSDTGNYYVCSVKQA